jgi:alkylation response protein AidB-like acyl-CoA dehydrogenase
MTLPDEVERALGELLDRLAGSSQTEFLGAQFDLGLAWVQFAPDRGGLGAAKDCQREIDRRLHDAGAPASPANFVGRYQVSATFEAIRSPAHQGFARRIFTGEDVWCQLFSEPGAGSDLANVGTLAVRGDSGWVATGQKVWTSGARDADYALLLARTDPGARKHRGMTMFVLDMHQPGVEVRPLRQADGGARFNEVFLTDVALDDALRLGEVGDGWGVSLTVLGTERDGASDAFHRPIEELLGLWRERADRLPAAMRDEVTRLWMESRVIELSKQRRRAAPDSPDAARIAAISKVLTSEHAQRLADLTVRVLGPAAVADSDYAGALADDMAGLVSKFAEMPPQRFLLRSRAMSIEGGTNEISRNIIGERVLGLPPDIRVDKDGPWSETSRGS